MDGPLRLIRDGFGHLSQAPRGLRVWTMVCVLLCAAFLPYWRTGPGDAGSWFAPLAVDSGYLHRQAPYVDFHAIVEAGYRLRTGEDPYGAVEETQGTPYATPFRYFPVNLLWLALPLGFVPLPLGAHVWVLAGLLLLGVNFLASVALAPERTGLLAFLWFVWFPLIPEWHLGQFNLLTGTLLFWTALAVLLGWRQRWAVLWALAAWLKLFPLALVPWLWRAGWRRPVVAALAVLLAVTGLWVGLREESAFTEQFFARDLEAGLLARTHQPYAGAQGLGAGVNATLWKARGLSFGMQAEPDGEPMRPDPVFLVSVLVLLAWAAAAVWVSRPGFAWRSFGPLVLLWLGWFLIVRDCWEHHTLFLQPLLILLVLAGLSGRVALAAWLFLGAPSLWWLWQRSGYQGNLMAETVGLLYFWQRPAGFVLLLWAAWHLPLALPGKAKQNARTEETE